MLSLAMRNLRRGARDYAAYFASLACVAAGLYLFSSLRYSPYVGAALGGYDEMGTAGAVSWGVMLAIGVGFSWYASDFFMRKRYRELGLYALYGMRRFRIGAMVMAEHLALGAAALALGCAAGFLLAKLFVMAVLRILKASYEVGLRFEPEALRDAALGFAAILLPAGLRAGWAMARYDLAWLFKAERAAERAPVSRPWVGVASAALLVAGYALALSSTTATVAGNFVVVAATTILASYGFLRSALPALLRALRSDRRSSWRGGALLAWAQLEHRVAGTVRLFTAIAVVGSAAMISLGFGLNAVKLIEGTLARSQPWDLSVQLGAPDPAVDALVRGEAARNDLSITAANAAAIVAVQASPAGAPAPEAAAAAADGRAELVGLLPRGLLGTGAANSDGPAPRLRHVSIGGPDGIRGPSALTLPGGELVELGGDPEASPVNLHGKPLAAIVFVDDELYARYARAEGARLLYQYAYRVSDREAMRELDAALAAALPPGSLVSYEELARYLRRFRLYLFLGFLSGLVFLASASALLFFKQLSESQADRRQFRALLELGAPRAALLRVIRLQTLPMFCAPLALGMVHSLVALMTMGAVFGVNFAPQIALTLGLFATVFVGFGAATSSAYRRAVLD